MIIQSLCNSCLQPFTINLQNGKEVNLLKQIVDDSGSTAPCPRLCGGRINTIGDPIIHAMAQDKRLRPAMQITGTELYQAVNGLGLPDEVPMSHGVVSLLLNEKIVGHFTEEVGHGDEHKEVYVHELRFSNGMTLHLTSGRYGARALKITKEAKRG